MLRHSTFQSLIRSSSSSSSSSLLLISSSLLSLKTLISAMATAPEDLSPPPTSDANSTPQNEVSSAAASVDADSPVSEDIEFGFRRSEMYKSSLSGTVSPYECHLFLCYKNPESWPSNVEGSESDRLPRSLSAALKSRKNDLKRNTRLTLCEGRDGTDGSNGDILIFPDMIRYRGLTHTDVDSFVEDVLVKGIEWTSRKIEALAGSHVFVCCHASRDRRCGVCGPALVKKFQEEIGSRELKDEVFVSPCSHVGGHKYAGNLIIFSSSIGGKVTGHWYGYVTPDDVSTLLDQHIGNGVIVERLWRGQMGLSDEQKSKSPQQDSKAEVRPDRIDNGKNVSEQLQVDSKKSDGKDVASCCRGVNGLTCCRDENVIQEMEIVANGSKVIKGGGKKDIRSWLKALDRSETYAALAVVGAVASVAVAYSIYKKSS